MKKNLFKLLILLSILFLQSCSNVKETFSMKKKAEVDEFLVKQKSPLTLPPEFDQLPIPNDEEQDKSVNKNDIKELFSTNKDQVSNTDSKTDYSSLEELLRKKIKNK
jgi:PBP1b-binding outer membrane lipoprotein LpoB